MRSRYPNAVSDAVMGRFGAAGDPYRKADRMPSGEIPRPYDGLPAFVPLEPVARGRLDRLLRIGTVAVVFLAFGFALSVLALSCLNTGLDRLEASATSAPPVAQSELGR